jgi:hypothetical protein
VCCREHQRRLDGRLQRWERLLKLTTLVLTFVAATLLSGACAPKQPERPDPKQAHQSMTPVPKYGAGLDPCSSWLTELAGEDGEDGLVFSMYVSWVQGFVSSGIAELYPATHKQPLNADYASMKRFVTGYCTRNPKSPIYAAAQEMTFQLFEY